MKLQIPNSKCGPRFGVWNLGFLWCLELGFWCFNSGSVPIYNPPGMFLSRIETCLLKTQNEAPNPKLQVRSAVWSLEPGISLVFGAWFLVFQFRLGALPTLLVS